MKRTGRNKEGQAIVEFLVALVAILALFSGLLLIASLTKAQTDTMAAARIDAGWRCITSGNLSGPAPVFIKTLNAGADRKQYSADDYPDPTSQPDQDRFINLIVNPAANGNWNTIDSVNNNQLSELHAAADPVAELGLVRGYDWLTINLELAVQHLFCRAPSIKIESTVWMAKTKDIY